MKRIPLNLLAKIESRTGANEYLKQAGDAVLIYRGIPRLLILKCPCGCGENFPVNLDSRAGKAWRLYIERGQKLTVYPSVWRDTDCQSHFVLRRNVILLFSYDGDGMREPFDAEIIEISKRVMEVWPQIGYKNYVEVADQLKEIPWDVLDACEYLVQQNLLIRGTGKLRGQFAKQG